MIDSLCDRGHTPYRQIGHRAVANVMRRAGIEYTHEEVRWLVALIERLKPFPDVLDALEQLHRRYRLAILSNGDPDMLAAAKPHIGFEFDARISVEEAGYFKPHHATYAKACERLGLDRSSVLFVASHAFDCIGAKAYGMRTAFIDRRRRPLRRFAAPAGSDRGGLRGARPGNERLSAGGRPGPDAARRRCLSVDSAAV